MAKYFYFFSFIFLLLIVACKKKSVNCGLDCGTQNEVLLFQTGFSNTVIGEEDKYNTVSMIGNDLNLDSLSDWQTFEDHSNIGKVIINYEEGSIDQRSAVIVPDPEDANNNVMKFQIWEPHVKQGSSYKGRVNTLIRENNCIKEIYESVDLFLHPDMAHLESWDEAVTWLTIFEFWNNGGLHKERRQFRVTVNLSKEKGAGNPVYFHVKGDQNKNLKWQSLWEETGTEYQLEYGKWIHIECYIKEGGENKGRFFMKIQPEGQSEIVLFDVTNYTQHPKEKCPDGYTDFNPHKLYAGEKLINYFKDNNKNFAVYWDNWKLYKNKQP